MGATPVIDAERRSPEDSPNEAARGDDMDSNANDHINDIGPSAEVG